jgi:sensor histidine kinase YesM
MKTILHNWWQRWQANIKAYEDRKLANLPMYQREEVQAFDRWWREHSWRNYGVLLVLWLLATVLLYTGSDDISWVASALVTGLVIFGTLFGLLSAWFGFEKFKSNVKTILFLILLTAAGSLLGFMVGAGLRAGVDSIFIELQRLWPKLLAAGLIVGVVYAILIVAVVYFRRRQLLIRNRELEQEAKQQRLARQLADAKLKLMQAQVEPHFLFNTLASVQQLAEGKAPEAARLTSDVITFLRAGLIGLRDDTSTLAREFEMADAYLNIMKVRMGSRLSAHVTLPDELAREVVPPAMLISLVENAIKHGVEPSLDGGAVSLSARREENHLVITVADTGLGLQSVSQDSASSSLPTDAGKSMSSGVGLSNIRERLHALYGDAAVLTITANENRGAIATIRIPQAGESK